MSSEARSRSAGEARTTSSRRGGRKILAGTTFKNVQFLVETYISSGRLKSSKFSNEGLRRT